jgi:hypothetical protein
MGGKNRIIKQLHVIADAVAAVVVGSAVVEASPDYGAVVGVEVLGGGGFYEGDYDSYKQQISGRHVFYLRLNIFYFQLFSERRKYTLAPQPVYAFLIFRHPVFTNIQPVD